MKKSELGTYKKYEFKFSLESPKLTQKTQKSGWFLLDVENGDIFNGRGYVWIFETKQQALAHKQKQHSSNKLAARLDGPWKITGMEELLLDYMTRPMYIPDPRSEWTTDGTDLVNDDSPEV